MALADAAVPTEVGTGANRRPARILQCLGGYDRTPSAIDTTEALHVRCKVAPPQPKREACVASMVTNVAVIRAVRQQHRPMVQASVIVMVVDTDV